MKILFDHQIFVEQEYGGISRYFFELSKGLKHDLAVDVENTILLSNNIFTADKLYRSRNFFPGKSFKGKASLLIKINEASSKRAINSNTYDVFHPTYYGTYFLKQKLRKPFVATFHDLTHEKLRHRFSDLKSDKYIFERRRVLLEKASKVIAVSANTKNDITEVYKIPEGKIEVVYLANSLKASDENLKIPYSNYILYVGNRQSYKNFIPFINAISPLLLKEPDLKVICAGGGYFKQNEMEVFKQLKVNDQLIQMPINDQLLFVLYKNAVFFVFPSLYEGFGIPVLEAFSAKCPVILSNNSSLPEIGGDAALYINPEDKMDILDKVSALYYSSALKNELSVAGFERQKCFSWATNTLQHYEIYKSLV